MAEIAAFIWSSSTSTKPKPLPRPSKSVGIVAPLAPYGENAVCRSASEVVYERLPTKSRLLIWFLSGPEKASGPPGEEGLKPEPQGVETEGVAGRSGSRRQQKSPPRAVRALAGRLAFRTVDALRAQSEVDLLILF